MASYINYLPPELEDTGNFDRIKLLFHGIIISDDPMQQQFFRSIVLLLLPSLLYSVSAVEMAEFMDFSSIDET